MLTMASATRSSRIGSGGGAPGSISLRTCPPTASINSTARVLASTKNPAGKPRGNAAQQLWHIVEPLSRELVRLLHRGRDGFLDAREIDDALAQHRLADL